MTPTVGLQDHSVHFKNRNYIAHSKMRFWRMCDFKVKYNFGRSIFKDESEAAQQ